MPLHGVDNCGMTAKVVGGLLCELLAIFKIMGNNRYTYMKKKIPMNGASLFLITALERSKKGIQLNSIAINRAITTIPNIAEDKNGSILNPVEIFQKYFNLIWRRHIIMLLIFDGKIYHCPTSFAGMSKYCSHVFKNKKNIEKIAENDASAIFPIYKMHLLADLGTMYTFQQRTTSDKQHSLAGINNILAAVTMLDAISRLPKLADDKRSCLLDL